MTHPRRFIPTLALLVLAIAAAPAAAEWSQDLYAGNIVCDAAESQVYAAIEEDGCGNFIVAWLDGRVGGEVNELYVQSIDADGNPRWDSNGILLVSPYFTLQYPVEIVPDGSGGAIVIYMDAPSSSFWEVYAAYIDPTGNATWGNPVNLFPDCEEISERVSPSAISDGAGGAIVAVEDYRCYEGDIYAQCITSSGTLLWGGGGVPVCLAYDDQKDPVAVSDESGGVIIGWVDERGDSYNLKDIYAQRLDSAGDPYWITNGRMVCTDLDDQEDLAAYPDGAGGALFCWVDYRDSQADIYASRIEPVSGSTWWASNGVPVCTEGEEQISPRILGDGNGGAYIVWRDDRVNSWDNHDIYAQHLAPSGTALWTNNGMVAGCEDGSEGYYGLELTSDGLGGVIIVWSGSLGSGSYQSDLKGQRISADGTKLWDYYGHPLFLGSGNQNYPKVAVHPRGGVVSVFQSYPGLHYSDIVAMYTDIHGFPGDARPVISGVTDFPSDQGGVVMLDWMPSYLDNLVDVTIQNYTIWKRLGEPARSGIDTAEFEHALAASGLAADKVEELLRSGWTYVDAIDAAYLEEYGYDAPSYGDSTETGVIYSEYKVIARNLPNVFWESEPALGYSVDNLAPGAPANLAALVEDQDIVLHWAPSGYHDEDLALYNIYRSDTPGFETGTATFLDTAIDTSFVDIGPGGGLWYYRVTALDLHGNEGLDSNEVLGEVLTAVNEGGTPARFALRGNWPNPFNPVTQIAFDLPSEGPVTLEVFDPAGRRIAILVDEILPAGSYRETWKGLDATGRPVSSGVYLARISFGNERATHRMLLLK